MISPPSKAMGASAAVASATAAVVAAKPVEGGASTDSNRLSLDPIELQDRDATCGVKSCRAMSERKQVEHSRFHYSADNKDTNPNKTNNNYTDAMNTTNVATATDSTDCKKRRRGADDEDNIEELEVGALTSTVMEKVSPVPFYTSDVTGSSESAQDARPLSSSSKGMSKSEREDRIADAMRTVLECLEDDSGREGLIKTPRRYAKALLQFTEGYRMSAQELVGDAGFNEDHREVVFLGNIDLNSLCEHHMVPFYGKCHIAYVPNGKVLGLSKLARITDMFSRRLQIQERLTKQIAHAVEECVEAAGVAVMIEATHMCMVMRGVKQAGTRTVTTSMLGCFREIERRNEFFQLLSCAKR